MKKSELVDRVAKASGRSREEVRAVLEATAAAVKDSLAAGDEVYLFGLGKLAVSSRGQKVARDLRTGAAVIVPPRKVAVFRPSTSVDDAVNARVPAAA